MSALWDTPAVSASYVEAQATRRRAAELVIVGTVLFNFVLCFVNTVVFPVTANLVIASEIGLIGIAFALTFDCSRTEYGILLLIGAYLGAVMALRSDFNPQFARDILIPVVFFFLGRHLGTTRGGDRLVTALSLTALAVGLFEWFALDTYLRFFDVIHYYLARGSVTGSDTEIVPGLYVSGTRADQRTLLPFLGDHRVSGIFLEPVSLGNFGAVAFAWVLLRDRGRPWLFAFKILLIATMLVLGDSRFGFFLCFATIAAYAAAPWLRPTMLFVAPFLMIFALLAFAGFSTMNLADIENDFSGRLLFAGDMLRALTPWQVFGLEKSDAVLEDAGYAYSLVNMGLPGVAAIWALFVYAPVPDRDAWRFKNFVALYIVALLAISTSFFTIKTAALLWFLYGTLNNPNREADASWTGAVDAVAPDERLSRANPGW
jgi:putative polymerase